MEWSDVAAGVTAEILCQKTLRCLGNETYNAELNGEFLNRLGNGTIISRVIEVRQCCDNKKTKNLWQGRGSDKDAYSSYGDGSYHNEGDKIELKCNLEFTNNYALEKMEATCKCTDEECMWTKRNEEWGCVDNENEQVNFYRISRRFRDVPSYSNVFRIFPVRKFFNLPVHLTSDNYNLGYALVGWRRSQRNPRGSANICDPES